jgi:uncharacterized glyoxalase superfamily protein PhnB
MILIAPCRLRIESHELSIAVCAELESHGITLLNGPVNREWGVRPASFTDPDGHIWEVAANIP